MPVPITDSHREAVLLEAGFPQNWIDEAKAAGVPLAWILSVLTQLGLPALVAILAWFGIILPPLPVIPPVPLPTPLKAKLKP